jgi:hypothetical protein
MSTQRLTPKFSVEPPTTASTRAKMPLVAQCLMTNLVIKINLAPPRPTEGRDFALS